MTTKLFQKIDESKLKLVKPELERIQMMIREAKAAGSKEFKMVFERLYCLTSFLAIYEVLRSDGYQVKFENPERISMTVSWQ